ncbi:MAG: methanol/ethanol family PQQ-dependent dehydrogenase [Alphaproteobacteria bacterium]|nr:methanol/ethanol family PQQ-dependent dehydrogenase [Alphaproteobacteria bacterium]MBV8336219.1 methanol/ethanol family PQQ-dependent dehydrogenase [Alphaproteobacteria bacterium]
MWRSGGLSGVLGVSALLLALNSISSDRAQAQGANSSQGQQQSGSDLNTLSQDQKQWVMAAKDYANTRFSSLDQINAGNVGHLQAAWSFSIGADRGQEAAPLVVDGTMYVVGPYFLPHPNQVFALDPTNGDLKWSYYPKPDPAAEGVACCDVVNRGLAYDNGKIFLATLDMNLVALDAKNGKELWHTSLGSINEGETITMAPLVVKGKILVGNSGGEMGVRGWLTAVDENTGKIVWRAYSTGPDKDVLIGQDFKPFYDWAKGQDLGVKSWPPDAWKIGGGTVWGWLQYDPSLNLIYYGTANAGPWNPDQRPGDNLWTTTIFARDADTGMANWADQLNPHDLWDYDEINESILLDLPINGQQRKVLVHIARSGFMYVIDRGTGEILSADAYETITNRKGSGVDLKTGRPIENAEMTPSVGKTIVGICPAAPGGKDWQPSAYSPRTKLIYVPHQHLCMDWKSSEVGYIAGTPYVGATVDMYAGPGGHRGEFMAWDPIGRKKVWWITEKLPVWSGTLVTAGDVAFYGTMDRWFKAVDAKSGKILWQFRAPSGIIGQPVTYMGSDGAQYLAILSGVGGWPGVVANAEVDPRVRNGALGFTGATQDLPVYTAAGSTLLVFALPPGQRGAAGPSQQPGAPGQQGAPPEQPQPNPSSNQPR